MTIRITKAKALTIRMPKVVEEVSSKNQRSGTCYLLARVEHIRSGNGHAVLPQLEKEKIDALKENKGNFDAVCTISDTCRSDLRWWCANIMSAKKKILKGNPDIIVRSDVSKEGWGEVK